MGWEFFNSEGRRRVSSLETVPVGTVLMYAGTSLPAGFLWCDGSAYSQTLYDELWAALGSPVYPAGAFQVNGDAGDPGAGNFRVPDFRGHSPIGAGSAETGTPGAEDSDGNASPASYILGTKAGIKLHKLSTSELAAHTHANTAAQAAHDHGGFTGLDGGHSHTPGTAGRSFVTAENATLTQVRVARDAGAAAPNRVDIVADTNDGNADYGQKNNPNTSSELDHKHTISSVTPSITVTNASEGGGVAHNNVGPVLPVNFIIKY